MGVDNWDSITCTVDCKLVVTLQTANLQKLWFSLNRMSFYSHLATTVKFAVCANKLGGEICGVTFVKF